MRRHVYFYTYIQRPLEQLAERFGGDPGGWLPAPAEAAEGGWLVGVHADGALPTVVAGHTTWIGVGGLGVAGDGEALLREVEWRSASRERMIPVLEGDLELASVNGHGCQLSLMGSYRPPMSVMGDAGDRLFGHRVAEACVRRFVLDVADRLAGMVILPA